MSSTPKVLYPAFYLPTSVSALYTSPANGKGTWIDVASALNDGAGVQQVTLYIVRGSVLPDQARPKAKAIAAGATDLLPEIRGVFLAAGDAIHGLSSASTTISLYMAGRELA